MATTSDLIKFHFVLVESTKKNPSSPDGGFFDVILITMKKSQPFLISGLATGLIMATLSLFIEDDYQARGTLVSGLIAAITIIAIPIYDVNRWSLAKRSIIHFLLMLVTVLPLLIYSEWFSPIIAVGVFFLFGAAGWAIGFGVNRLQTHKKTH